jgi:hypothetical protein
VPIYPQSKESSDGRALARELATLRASLSAVRRRAAVGDVPDPTPPPDEVAPGSLTVAVILNRKEQS